MANFQALKDIYRTKERDETRKSIRHMQLMFSYRKSLICEKVHLGYSNVTPMMAEHVFLMELFEIKVALSEL